MRKRWPFFLHLLCRDQYNKVKAAINKISPFLTLTKHEFATNTADKVVKKSKHEAINKELQLINGQLEWAAHIVDDTEWLLGVKTRWQCGDAEY